MYFMKVDLNLNLNSSLVTNDNPSPGDDILFTNYLQILKLHMPFSHGYEEVKY